MSASTPQALSSATGEQPVLLLVDGSSYLYRAYHAMPDLRSGDGFPTGAIHGLIAMMRRLREQVPACWAACVFDAKGPTFRDDWYPDYKGHRPSMPEDLAQQIAPIHEVVRIMGWPLLQVEGVEADDVIGTLAQRAQALGARVVISTGDKDMAQLVTPEVTLLNTMTQESLDAAGVLAKFGVPPERIVDYLSLVGDAVDNVPGVPKVGPKTAVKWLAEHGSLDAVMAAAESIGGVVGQNLRDTLNWLPMARRLVTIRCDCDLSAHLPGWPQLEALQQHAPDLDALLGFYRQYGFRSWGRELEGQIGPGSSRDSAAAPAPAASGQISTSFEAVPVLPGQYETVDSEEALARWLALIQASPLTALDTETTGLDPLQAQVVGLSLALIGSGDGGEIVRAAYIPLAHEQPSLDQPAPQQLDRDAVLARLRPWLEDAGAAKVGQNIKFDTHILANHGITVRGWAHDTLLESYVLEAHRPHGLESLAQRHLNRQGLSYEDLCGKGAKQIPLARVPVDQVSQYACEDADFTLQVHRQLWPQIQADAALDAVYTRIELPVADVLQRMERDGIGLDVPELQRQSADLHTRMTQLEGQIYEQAGGPFNLGSPKQIGEVLFGRMGLPQKKSTATGAASTSEEVLQELAEDYPLPALILQHRSLSKLKSTYTDKLPAMVNPDTGRVHTSYSQAVAVTGRLSSNEPNLQNIPIRTPEGRRVRRAFVARPGHVLLSADYSQIELRLMAHISQDAGLLRAFREGIDVHRATAADIFGVASPDEVSADQRRYAKTINFGLIYGMGAFGLARALGIANGAAKDYIERYFARYPGVRAYMDRARQEAAAQGYVSTVYGRRLWLPDIKGGNGPRKAAAERQAINAPLQGTAADLIKLAMIAVDAELSAQQRATRMLLQVHDELVFEVPDAELAWARERLPQIMGAIQPFEGEFAVPLTAEVGVGANWDEAH
ncbi:DNA polymerase I [Amphibiibacter pelophylacis]|uniref:DNA polymerase I n=1 Tax=Amphibiibacter pelophylacis TaxID=1799477 RepID=A0ACC6P0Z4_9BURK